MRDIDEFLQILGGDKEDILSYCIGEDWKRLPVKGSHTHFNEKLGIDLKATDSIKDSAYTIKSAWISHKRNIILNKIDVW